MESIANRAGVSKVSLYRRWGSKLAVVADVLRLMSETTVPKDQGSFEADIRFLLRATIGPEDAKKGTRSARKGVLAKAKVLMRTMGEISGNPQLLALYREHLLAPRLAQIRGLVDRARARKELRPDLATEAAAAMIAGPLFLYYLSVLAELDGELPKDLVEQLTRSILRGIVRPPGPGAA